ncbi:ion channel domain-containing protein [Ditylenchus destructor]|nr:ion channel domain-containing protein [Ditylenchus destructor]
MSIPLQRSADVRWHLRELRRSFTKQTRHLRNALQTDPSGVQPILHVEAQSKEARSRKSGKHAPPKWARVIGVLYHTYGLKQLFLVALLFFYQFIGACVFYLCEVTNDEAEESAMKASNLLNRNLLVHKISDEVSKIWSNSSEDLLILIKENEQFKTFLDQHLQDYENKLELRASGRKMRWNFWNAMLYAHTIYTTIGYGHLYTKTIPGRILTIIYAIFGIPLMLKILDELGRFLTRLLNGVWILANRIHRLLSCKKDVLKKKMTHTEGNEEKASPPVALAVAVLLFWISLCSVTYAIFEEWDIFMAFYFFFISISTIGLGDIIPSEPKYLLLLFFYILIGLSLVSMCINLVQEHFETVKSQVSSKSVNKTARRRTWSSLGVFRSSGSTPSYSQGLKKETVQARIRNKMRKNLSTQTMLSFPSGARNSLVARNVINSGLKLLPKDLSLDDVVRLTDFSDEGDIALLSDILRDESSGMLSETGSEMTRSSSDFTTTTSSTSASAATSQHDNLVRSTSFERTGDFPNRQFLTHSTLAFPTTILAQILAASRTNFVPIPVNYNLQPQALNVAELGMLPSLPTLRDLELIEELEDRMLLSAGGALDIPSVHFRSRLSLIPEQHSESSTVDEEPEDISMSTNDHTPTNADKPPIAEFDVEKLLKKKQKGSTEYAAPIQIASSSSRSSGLSGILGNLFGGSGGSKGSRASQSSQESFKA